MRKSNNKGFSLIEVIISVAVLTILVVPIMMQLTKALETNANAKERQAAVENADEVLEYFQKTSKETLDQGGTGEINGSAGATSDFTTVATGKETCQLYSMSGAKLTNAPEYNVTTYTAPSVKLGRKQNEYNRTIIVDDLNNKVMSEGYRISTTADITDTLKTNSPGVDWVKTNEGNVVGYEDGKVVAAVVEEHTNEEKAAGYVDPNELNLGYVQNLDSETMAIIPTDVFQLDEQFKNDIYKTVLEAVIEKRADGGVSDSDWDSMMELRTDAATGYEGTALDYAIRRANVEKDRVISVNVSHDTTDPNNDFYRVSVDVFYTATLDNLQVGTVKLDFKDSEGKDRKESYSYPVYSKDFVMNQPPDVYMVYEPLVSAFVDVDYYVPDDYIVVSADYDCVKDRTKMCKFYLVKPSVVTLTGKSYADGTPCVDEAKGMFYSYSFDVSSSGEEENKSYPATNLHISSLKSTNGAEEAEPMEIYTNIATKTEEDEKDQFVITGDNTNNGGIPSTVYESNEFKTIFSKYNSWSDMDYKYIRPLTDGSRTLARLFTVRVSLKNKTTGDEIHITGAKGAD